MIRSGLRRICHSKRTSTTMMLILVILLFLGTAGTVFASSGGGHGEEGAAPKGWVATDTYRVMNFVVLAVALFFVLKKPVSQALSGRISGIKTELEELEAKKKEAEKQLAEYNEKLSKLDGEAEAIIQEYVRQGEEAKARILKEAESAAEKLEEQAQRHIDHEFKQAKKALQTEIVQKALSKAEEIIKAKITDEDQDRLVDEYLEKVVA
jgi:F-type H+-transporting ATPase subunit b